MAELCIGSKPLHRLYRQSVNVVLTKPIVQREIHTSESRQTSRRFGVAVEGCLDQ